MTSHRLVKNYELVGGDSSHSTLPVQKPLFVLSPTDRFLSSFGVGSSRVQKEWIEEVSYVPD